MIARPVLLAALLVGLPAAASAQQNRFEPNQTRRTAQKIEPGDYKGLLCNQEDWFLLDVPRGQRVEVQIKFAQAQGDLELLLQDSRGRNLAWSRGTQDEEALAFAPMSSMPVFVRVHSEANNTYDLHVGVVPTAFAGAGTITDVNCWGSDWYPFTIEAGKELRAEINFAHGKGDLDMAIHDEEGNELATSTGQGDDERVVFTASESRTVLLKVWNPHRARNVYTMRTTLGVAVPDDLARVLRRDRPAGKGQDLVELTNGDVLHGALLNESFKLITSYADLDLAADRVAGIDLERNRSDQETIITVDNNKLSGFLRTPVFRFKLDGLEAPVEIRRERILRVVFGCRGQERAKVDRHQYVVLKNGDHFSAKVIGADWTLDMGFARVPLALPQVKSLTFDGNGGVALLRMNEQSTKGRLNIEDIELELDIARAGSGQGPRFKLHPDRIEVLYGQEGFVPDSMQSVGSALSFDFEEGIEPWAPQGNWNTNFVHWPRDGVRGDGCMRVCGPNGGNYGDNANVNCNGPPMQIAGLQAPALRLQVRTRLERGPDFFVIRVSYDGGQTFTEANRITGDQEWTPVTIPLQPGSRECVVQFGLTTDGSIVNGGVWIDAVEVLDNPGGAGGEGGGENEEGINIPQQGGGGRR